MAARFSSSCHLASDGGRSPWSTPGQWALTEQQIAIQGELAGVVVASEFVAQGWRVWVDDAPAPALIADTLLRAVWVPPGRHRITWRYRP